MNYYTQCLTIKYNNYNALCYHHLHYRISIRNELKFINMNKNKHINLQTIIRHLTSKQCHTTLQDLGVVITIVVYRTCECITYVTIIIIKLLLKVIRLLQFAMTHQTFL